MLLAAEGSSFLDACLSATLSSVLLNGGWSGSLYRVAHYKIVVGRVRAMNINKINIAGLDYEYN